MKTILISSLAAFAGLSWLGTNATDEAEPGACPSVSGECQVTAERTAEGDCRITCRGQNGEECVVEVPCEEGACETVPCGGGACPAKGA